MPGSKPPSKPPATPIAPLAPLEDHPKFSVDRETTGMSMPSVTQLLNRKSMTQEIQKGNIKTPPPAAPPPPGPSLATPTLPPRSPSPSAQQPSAASQNTRSLQQQAPAQEGGQLVKTAKNDREKGLISLKEWSDISPEQFKGGSALSKLFQEGQKLNLWSRMLEFRATSSTPSPQPDFLAHAAWGPSDAALLWDGVRLKTSKIPMSFAQLSRSGWVDLPALTQDTSIESECRVLREALGANKQEGLICVRLGPPQAPWGLTFWFTQEGAAGKAPGKSLGAWASQHLAEAGKIQAPG